MNFKLHFVESKIKLILKYNYTFNALSSMVLKKCSAETGSVLQ